MISSFIQNIPQRMFKCQNSWQFLLEIIESRQNGGLLRFCPFDVTRFDFSMINGALFAFTLRRICVF